MNAQTMRAEMLAAFRAKLADLAKLPRDETVYLVGWPAAQLYYGGIIGAGSARGIMAATRFTNEYEAARIASATRNGNNERAQLVTLAGAIAAEEASLRGLIAGLT